VECRANLMLKGERNVRVRVQSADGRTTKTQFVGDTAAATARIRELASQSPGDTRMMCRLGSCLRDQGKTEEAITEFRGMLKDGQACANTRVTLGKALVSMGLPEEGMQEFELATTTSPDYAMGWLELGLVQARLMRNPAGAVECFRKYLALEPNSSIADKVARYISTAKT